MFSTGICRWLFLLVSLATWVTLTSSKEMRVVCYYTNWSVYRPGDAKFSPQNINPYLCTHLIYAFGGFTKENTLKPFDKYQDIEKGGYAKFNGLKTYNKNLKTLLAIGGWNEGSARFSPMVASSERRKEFAKNAIKFLRLNHFDGLDLDWEYPSFRDGGKPRDRDNYPLLVQDLREEFDKEAEKTGRPRLLLTMAVPAGIEYINKGFDVPKITRYVDWMNILSYDYHSAFEPSVNHHAPLYSLEEESEYNYDSDLNIHYSIKHYLKNGADPSKLVLGIPTYGRSYTLLNPESVDIGSPADGPGSMGEATRENGYLAYYEICEYVKNDDWEVEKPNSKVMGPFAFKDNQWVGYDDEEIVKRKAEYVAENNLGGIMFWSIDNDDFRGKCHGKAYPLIEAGRAALIAAYGVTDDNLIAPTKKPLKSRTRTRTKTLNKVESSDDEKTEKPEKLQTRRRNRVRPTKSKQVTEEETTTKRNTRRKESKDLSNEETSSYSSLKVVTPSYTTPAPPATPDVEGDFKCEEDGFFPHPKDCKKYFWCLSGPGDSGIIAHQFTCPAGLYFNKAADSCDYTQNVLCNKKTQKSTTAAKATASSSTTSAPSSFLFSTSRPPPKITAATSKTTFVQTTSTTTEAYEEDDEEYEDEEVEDTKQESEEDPRVIKELIELIKKAGGLEELERQFNVKGDTSNNSEHPTTKSSLSKTLYERVISKAIKNTPTQRPTANTKSRNSFFRNSRGPQSEKTEDEEEKESQKKSERGKLQYTSVSRFRPSASRDKKIEEDDNDDEEEETKQITEIQGSRKVTDKFPAYTNIRRARVSTTTKSPENDRNKILGEAPIDDEEETDDEEEETDSDKELASSTKKSIMPQYVNIRRQRPSTTEEASTNRYTEIRRGTTAESPSTEGGTSTTSKYKQIRRGTTTASTKKPFAEEAQSLSTNLSQDEIPVTEPAPSESELGKSSIPDQPSNKTREANRNEYLPNVITTTTRTYITTTDDINFVKSEANESKSTEKPNLPSKPNLFNPVQRKRPQLFEPRPFSKPTEATAKPTATQITKVSHDLDSKIDKINKEKPSINFRSRGSSRFNPQKTLNATESEENSEIKEATSKRRLIVTEKYIEDHRSYRPSELADLSSLTAVDFDNIKELQRQTNQRRRRPLKPSTTTTTTETPQKSLLPFKRRRINVNNNNNELPKTTERIIVPDSLPSTSRSRKIIRRFRTTASTTETVETTTPISTSMKPTKLLLDVSSNNNEVDDDTFEDTSTEEFENIKLSESNIRENSDINSFAVDPKLKNKFIKTDLFGKSSVLDKTDDNQKEKSSTSSNIDVSSTEATRTKEIIRKIIPTESKIADKTFTDSEQIVGRRRKIIRKFRPILPHQGEENKATETPSNSTVASESSPETDNSSSLEKVAPKRIFRPREGNRRYTPVTPEPEVTSPKYSQRNRTVLLRGPSKTYKQKINITTTTETPASSQRYSLIPRRSTKLLTSSTEVTSQQSITTTESEDDEDADTATLTNDSITTESMTFSTTEYGTETEESTVLTTESDNINEVNSNYTEIPSTTINDLQTTTIKLEESGFSTENVDFNTTDTDVDTTTSIDITTSPQTSTTEALQKSSLEYKSNILRPIESRPKFIPSKLKNLNINENAETTSGFKPKPNYRNRLQSTTSAPSSTTEKETSARFSTKSSRRYNKFRPGVSTSDSLENVESSSALPINKALYKYKKPKKSQEQSDEENIDKYKKPVQQEIPEPEGEVSSDRVNNEEGVSVDNKKEDSGDDIKAKNNKTLKAYSKPSFSKTITEKPITDELKDVNTDAVRNRNKNLFNSRKTNKETVEDNKKPVKEETEDEAENEENEPDVEKTMNNTEESITDELKVLNTDAVSNRNKNLFNSRKPNEETVDDNKKPIKEDTENEGENEEKKPDVQKTMNNTEELITDELKKVNTDAVRNRNKNLFNSRKPNKETVEDNKKPVKEETGDGAENEENEPDVTNKENEDITTTPKHKYTPTINTSTFRPSNKPHYSKPSFSKIVTEEPKTNEDLKDINTDAVKTRNKNLFNNRKANSNIFNHSTAHFTATTEEPTALPTTVVTEETATYIDADTTFVSTPQPTESTTLVHVFAEKEETVITNQTTKNKVERLIEVNRIVNVKTKEDIVKNHRVEHITDEESPILDKIGAINRVTVIKVVDKDGKLVNSNETTTESPIKSSVDMIIQIAKIQEIPGENMGKINLTSISVDVNTPAPATSREERKLDVTGGKVEYSKHEDNGKAEIFGGLSHINIITPRSAQLTESSTIALEGLFQTEKPNLFTSKNSINDELLETENSKFVNVRILHPDEGYRINKKLEEEPKVIPIKILKQDEDDFVMKAKVIEVSTKSQFNTFKIVPIKVEAAKRLPPPLPLIRINRQYN